jgi:hypothetical protein
MSPPPPPVPALKLRMRRWRSWPLPTPLSFSKSKLSNEAKDEDVEEVSIAYSLDISEVEGSILLSSTNVQVDVVVTEQRGGRIIDPWCVLYADRGVLWTHHIFTFCIFVITYFTCDLIIIFIFP